MSDASDRVVVLKRELVLLLGGAYCTWDDESVDCEECEYPTNGRDLVFHNASYEYSNEGDYRCTDCFLAYALRPPMTKSMEEQWERETREEEARRRARHCASVEAARLSYALAEWGVANAF